MATNIPPHNLGEVADACIEMIEDPEVTDERLLEIVPGPDFPTGAYILGRGGARSALLTGRGSVLMRSKVAIEQIRKDRDALIVTEIPYQVNKKSLVEKIGELRRDKKVEGIADIRDESSREGMRVVIEIKRDAMADVVLNQLYRYSQLQTSFGVNTLALNNGRPEMMNLRRLLQAFITFREEVVTRRTKFELNKARDEAHKWVGLAIAVANIEKIINLIRTSPDRGTARARLIAERWDAKDIVPLLQLIADHRSALDDDKTIRLTDVQADAILDMRLSRLTALGMSEIDEKLKEFGARIEYCLGVLRSRIKLMEIIREELTAARDEFATPRRTEFLEADFDMEDEDLIQQEDVVVTVTHTGYIKRVPLNQYRTQRRGGKGRSGMSTKDEDFVTRVFVANTHTPVLFFSSTGMVYRLKVWRLPEGTPQARGKAMVNLLPLDEGETISTVLPLDPELATSDRHFLVFATRSGNVRRNAISDFERINVNGKIAMKLDEGDGIIGVQIATEDDDFILNASGGKSIRFPVTDVRVFKGRDSTGVRGIRLGKDNEVVSMSILRHVKVTPPEARAYLRHAAAMRRAASGEDGSAQDEPISLDEGLEGEETTLSTERLAALGAAEQFILTVTENGYGKRTSAFEYRAMGRGGQGVVAITINARNGGVVAAFPVEDADEIMLVTDGGQLIRCPVDDVRVAGRNTQGVTIFRTAADETVVSVEHLGDTGGTEEEGEISDESGGE
jgi:DNA gyrase subunit A